MRGMAGPTMVWLMDATSMPSMSAMKMLRPARSRPGAVLLGATAVAERAVCVGPETELVATPWDVCGMPSTIPKSLQSLQNCSRMHDRATMAT